MGVTIGRVITSLYEHQQSTSLNGSMGLLPCNSTIPDGATQKYDLMKGTLFCY